MRKLHILFARNLFYPADLGGNAYPYEVSRRLAARGHRLTAVTGCLNRAWPTREQREGLDFYRYRVNRSHPALTFLSNALFSFLLFRKLGPPGAYDVGVLSSYDVAAAYYLAGRGVHAPSIFIYHSQLYSEWLEGLAPAPSAFRRGLHWAGARFVMRVERFVFDRAHCIVAVSDFSRRQIVARWPRSAEKIALVSTGVDTAFFAPPADKGKAKAKLGFEPQKPLLLAVGRLAAVKRYDVLVEAAGLLARQGVPFHLVLVGTGPQEGLLRAQVAALGLTARVTFAGFRPREEVRDYMQAADLQICPSKFENRSLAVLEALACGTPVLSVATGGTPEILSAIDADLLVPEGTAQAIAGRLAIFLRRWAEDGANRSLSALCRRAAEGYDWERVVDSLEGLCQEVACMPPGKGG